MRTWKSLLALILLAGGTALASDTFKTLDRVEAARLSGAENHAVPTIVALWSSECVHCKKNLERFTEMVGEDVRIRLVSVAVEPAFDGLAAPLDRIGVPGERFAYGSESPEAIAYALDSRWRGELPRTILFDGQGGRTAVSGVLSKEAVLDALGLAASVRR